MEEQKKKVLDYIKEHGSISIVEASRDLGLARLSWIIISLRKDGHRIVSTSELQKNEHGRPVPVIRYSFPE